MRQNKTFLIALVLALAALAVFLASTSDAHGYASSPPPPVRISPPPPPPVRASPSATPSKPSSGTSSKPGGATSSKPSVATASKPSTGSKAQPRPVPKLIPPPPPTLPKVTTGKATGGAATASRIKPPPTVTTSRYNRDRQTIINNPRYADPYGASYYGAWNSPFFYLWAMSLNDGSHSNDPLPPEADNGKVSEALLSYLGIIEMERTADG